ncbi:hypothetical protein CWC48_22380 [Pseudomonas sp. S10E 269]|nr:hypothetical protein CWC49_02830 [Pseudomonas sp. S09F 262]PJK41762.1 hypothetical protein CWC48_22380 [Pseudomonas sp. S10E 269]
MWERACSRMRWLSWPIGWLTLRIREQARSHTCPAVFPAVPISPSVLSNACRPSPAPCPAHWPHSSRRSCP